MPATINGIALHPLLVHAVVVLVPLTVLAAVALAVSTRVRARYGWLFVGLGTLALFSVPLATNAGESLQARIPETPAIVRHAHMGDQLLPLVFLMWLAMVGVMLLHRWGTLPSDGPGTAPAPTRAPAPIARVDAVGSRLSTPLRRRLAAVAAVVAVLGAVGSAVQCYRIGDSGAKAVWHGVGTGPARPGADGDSG